jgi:thymidine kinase
MRSYTTGWIEVICGSMFSGKSEELIRRVRRARIARQKVAVFKPAIDDRYDETAIVSHSELTHTAVAVRDVEHLRSLVEPDVRVVAIDEAQFFDDALVGYCEHLADSGVRVIVAGLDQDFRGRPFGPIPHLLAVAEEITKTMAVCVRCGAPANRTQRLTKDGRLVVVGASELYEARCRKCFVPGGVDPQEELL